MSFLSFHRRILRPFRKRRLQRFMQTFSPRAETTILDVGGTPFSWRLCACPAQISLLNLGKPHDLPDSPDNFSYVQGDGTQLAYDDASFDIAFSNSVIEHVGTYENQEKFAHEIRRAGKRVWVQTPARCFFLEPHLVTPFIHWLPERWQRKLLRNATLWGWSTRPSQEQVDAFLDEVRLLNYAEMKALFPDCTIQRERFFGMTKAYVAVR